MLNPVADRILCTWIGRWLNKATLLGQRRFHRLLQLGGGYSVCEHPLPFRFVGESVRRLRFKIEDDLPEVIHALFDQLWH